MFDSLSIGGVPGVVLEKPLPQLISRRSSDSNSDVSSSSSSDSPMMVTDSQGNVQFLDKAQPPAIAQDEIGCGLLQMLRTTYGNQRRQSEGAGNAGCYYPPVPYPSSSENNTSPAAPAPDFLETILTHREAFVAFPYGHRTCSKALTQLAFSLEHHAAQSGADGDLDTAIALHNEAWLMSGWCK